MGALTVTKRQPRLWRRLTRAPWLAGGVPAPRAGARKGSPDLSGEADEYRRMAFTFAMIALAAKISKCDGAITREEFLTFREVFPLHDEESAKIRRLFHLAWEDGADAEYYARQVTALYPENAALRRELMLRLCAIALADGDLKPGELQALTEIGQVFGYSRMRLSHLLAEAAHGQEPHQVLGVRRGAPVEQIKTQYRALMRVYHPDRVERQLSYPEAKAVASRKAAAINAAYAELVQA